MNSIRHPIHPIHPIRMIHYNRHKLDQHKT
jgi:hypothetical protein